MSILYDTHCHLDLIKANSIEQIVKEATENDVLFMNTINTNLDDFEKIAQIANIYDNVFCSIGQHPLYISNTELKKEDIETFITDKVQRYKNKIVAIGETGLDFYKNNNEIDYNTQILWFEKHIQASISNELPLVIHSRNAEKETIDILSKYNKATGVMHCFTGSKWMLSKALDLGFYISISGIVTFKKANDLQDLLNYIPLDRLITETDSPYLSPEPLRGKECNPSYMKYTNKFIANFLNIKFETFNQTVFQNASKLFLKK